MNSLSLSLLVTKRWQVEDGWSRFKVQSPAMKLFQHGGEALFRITCIVTFFFLKRCTEVIKREH